MPTILMFESNSTHSCFSTTREDKNRNTNSNNQSEHKQNRKKAIQSLYFATTSWNSIAIVENSLLNLDWLILPWLWQEGDYPHSLPLFTLLLILISGAKNLWVLSRGAKQELLAQYSPLWVSRWVRGWMGKKMGRALHHTTIHWPVQLAGHTAGSKLLHK